MNSSEAANFYSKKTINLIIQNAKFWTSVLSKTPILYRQACN